MAACTALLGCRASSAGHGWHASLLHSLSYPWLLQSLSMQVWQAMNTAVAAIRAAEKDAGQYPHIVTVQVHTRLG